MAKKSVASLQTGSKRLTKAIKIVKSPKSGAYTFVESIMAPNQVKGWLAKKQFLYIIYLKAVFAKKAAFFIFTHYL